MLWIATYRIYPCSTPKTCTDILNIIQHFQCNRQTCMYLQVFNYSTGGFFCFRLSQHIVGEHSVDGCCAGLHYTRFACFLFFIISFSAKLKSIRMERLKTTWLRFTIHAHHSALLNLQCTRFVFPLSLPNLWIR